MLTILCREEPTKCRDVANSNIADTTIQCETYELAEFGEEYEVIPALNKGGQQVQGLQDSATQNVPTLYEEWGGGVAEQEIVQIYCKLCCSKLCAS